MSNLTFVQAFQKRGWPWPTPIKHIANGANGKVYEADDGRIIKFIAGESPTEIQALRNLQRTHIVPSHGGTKNSVTVKLTGDNAKRMFPNLKKKPTNMTIIVMGKAGRNKSMTLENYILKYPAAANRANVQRRVEYLIEQMHLKGWAHGNLHSGNIIVSVSPTGKITGMWVIDFGRAYKLNGQTEREAFMKLKYNLKYPTFPTENAFYNNIVQNLPTRGTPLRRANVNMMSAHYGKYIDPVQEQYWRNIRKFALNEVAKYLKSPKKTLGRKLSTPTPRRSPKKPTHRRRVSV